MQEVLLFPAMKPQDEPSVKGIHTYFRSLFIIVFDNPHFKFDSKESRLACITEWCL